MSAASGEPMDPGMRKELESLEHELLDGEITEKGYNKRRSQILSSYGKTWDLDSQQQGIGAVPRLQHSRQSSASSVTIPIPPRKRPISMINSHSRGPSATSLGSAENFSNFESSPQLPSVSNSTVEQETQVNKVREESPAHHQTSPATFDTPDNQGASTPEYSAYNRESEDSSSYIFDSGMARYNSNSARKTSMSVRSLPLQPPLMPRLTPKTGYDANRKPLPMSHFDSIPSILRHRGKTSPKDAAFLMLDVKGKETLAITWEKFASRSEKVSQVIHDKSGLYRGDRVCLMYREEDFIDFSVALMGCFIAGVVAVPINELVNARDVANILRSTQAHLVLTTEGCLKAFQKLLSSQNQPWPKGVEFWKTSDFGSYHPSSKKSGPRAMQVPDLAYIEYHRGPTGDLRGVVISHKTLLHQMMTISSLLNSRPYSDDDDEEKPTEKDFTRPLNMGPTIVSYLDNRQSIGLIIGVFLVVYTGSTFISMRESSMATPGLYANILSRYRASYALADYPGLKTVVYNYQTFPHATRSFTKKKVNLSSLMLCLIDSSTVDSEFDNLLADRWLRPLGNNSARDVVAPMLTLTEHGGMVIAMRDWLGYQERLRVPVNTDDESNPSDLSSVSLDKQSLASNTLKILSTSPVTALIGNEQYSTTISVGAFGYPIPDAVLAIVDPETCRLAVEQTIGEIWVDSACLSGGFWNADSSTKAIFRARCMGENGQYLESEFLRTGLLGFTFDGKLYVLGFYEDRLRQRIPENELEEGSESSKALGSPHPAYRYHYTSHLVQTIMRNISRVFDCATFDVSVNEEHLPIVVMETVVADSSPLQPNGTPVQIDTELLEKMAGRCINVLFAVHGVRVYCVLVTAPLALPRVRRNGRWEIGNMLCKRKFELGSLPSVVVKFGVEKAVLNIPSGPDPIGGIWSLVSSGIRQDMLFEFDKQMSGYDNPEVVIDDRSRTPLTDFSTILAIFQWRVTRHPDELAYCTIDGRGREGKGVSWKKLDQKIASVATIIKNKGKVKPGDHVVLIYTHSEDFVHAVYACLCLKVVAIPVAPIDVNRLNEDVPALLSIIKDYGVKTVLVNADTDSAIRSKATYQHLKQSAVLAKIQIPSIVNTTKSQKSVGSCTENGWGKVPANPRQAVILWTYFTPDHRRVPIPLDSQMILSLCKVQKETCQMKASRPILACVRSTIGLGFIYACFLGTYLGSSTYFVSPVDFAVNPLVYFVSLSRYKIRDAYCTPPMLEHAIRTMQTKGFSLRDTKNLIIPFSGRPDPELCKAIRLNFASTGLDRTAINTAYNHVFNPMISSRSYMSVDALELYLDRKLLRQGLICIVDPKDNDEALMVQDSGMVSACTQVAIVNPETRRLCHLGEYGEIWVCSDANAYEFYRSNDEFEKERFHGHIVDGERDRVYCRTGDLGFLYSTSRPIGRQGSVVEVQYLFVLGSIGESFDVCGLSHFPIDIEASIERSHHSICSGGSAIFQAAGLVIVIVEVSRKSYLSSLVPIVVDAVLNDHQLLVDIVAFVGLGDFPRSRLGDKQRGRLLAAWVTRKLNTLAQFAIGKGGSSGGLNLTHSKANSRSSAHSQRTFSHLRSPSGHELVVTEHEILETTPIQSNLELPASRSSENSSKNSTNETRGSLEGASSGSDTTRRSTSSKRASFIAASPPPLLPPIDVKSDDRLYDFSFEGGTENLISPDSKSLTKSGSQKAAFQRPDDAKWFSSPSIPPIRKLSGDEYDDVPNENAPRRLVVRNFADSDLEEEDEGESSEEDEQWRESSAEPPRLPEPIVNSSNESFVDATEMVEDDLEIGVAQGELEGQESDSNYGDGGSSSDFHNAYIAHDSKPDTSSNVFEDNGTESGMQSLRIRGQYI